MLVISKFVALSLGGSPAAPSAKRGNDRTELDEAQALAFCGAKQCVLRGFWNEFLPGVQYRRSPAYCNLNEGVNKVMDFGALQHDSPSLGARCLNLPVLSAALDGIDLTAIGWQGRRT